MKKILYLIIALLPVAFASCSDDNDKVTAPTASGTMTDDEGNEYGWVRIGNLDWTTSTRVMVCQCMNTRFLMSRGGLHRLKVKRIM